MLGMLGAAPLAIGGVAQSFAATSAPGARAMAGAQTPSAKARRRIQEQHLPNIPLLTHEGKRVLFYDDLVKNKNVSMNFFYANCDEICPLVMANLAKVQRLLGRQVGRDLFMYSFTLKPTEDSIDDIREHRKMLGAKPGWTFFNRQARRHRDHSRRHRIQIPGPGHRQGQDAAHRQHPLWQ